MAEWNRGNESDRDRERERERERWNRPEGERSWRDRERDDDRGVVARGTDEVRSWFGDDDAERRRRSDEQRDAWRDRDRDRPRYAWGDDRASRFDWDGGGRAGTEGHWSERGEAYGRGPYSTRDGRWQDQERRHENRPVPERPGASSDWNTGSERTGQREWPARDRERDQDRDRSRQATSYFYTEVWMIPGPFSGHGPRGYQRGDERIMEDVCERLTHHGQIDARNIDVHVQGSEVYLRGAVDSREAKRHAEDVAEAVSGVREVHNELRVQRPHDTSAIARGAGITGSPGATRDRDLRPGNTTATPEDRPSRENAPDIQTRAGLGNTPESGQDNPDSILGLSPTAGGVTRNGATPGTTPAGTTPASDPTRGRNRSTT